ncbi:hypothetical protein LCGC14_2622580, partial [marine sediment metagenome]
ADGGRAAERVPPLPPDGLLATHTFFPKTSAEDVRLELAQGAGNPDSEFLKKYPGWNIQNLESGINWLSDGQQALVPRDSPIVELYNDVREREGLPVLGAQDEDVTGYFTTKQSEARRCIDLMRSSLHQYLQMSNLYDTKFSISRTYTSAPPSASEPRHKMWKDNAEIFDDVPPKQSAQAIRMAEPFSLYVKVLFRYKAV